jgi:hypothetical protein
VGEQQDGVAVDAQAHGRILRDARRERSALRAE